MTVMSELMPSGCVQAAAASGAIAAPSARSGQIKLLLIEPDAVLSQEFKRLLEAAGFEVELGGAAGNGAGSTHFPVVMIGGGMPAEERTQLLRRLREGDDATASLLLAAPGGDDGGTEDSLPARDHLLAAFQIEAIVARLQSLLARKAVSRAVALRFGNVSIDGDGQVTIAGRVAYLQATEVSMLSLLMRRKGKIVPKRSIETILYGKSDGAAANAVEVCVHRLRKSLVANAANLRVCTIRNAGYFVERHDLTNSAGATQVDIAQRRVRRFPQDADEE